MPYPHQSGRARPLYLTGAVLLAVLALAAFQYGPDLLAYQRFSLTLESTSQVKLANGGPWPQVNEACIACHGERGNPVNHVYARLAGQPAPYLVRQLQAFADGQRASPTMAPLALDLTPADIDGLAAYFARQAVTPSAYFTPDPARRTQGELRAKAANCASCHGAGLTGQGEIPRLAGQGHDYLVAQLDKFKRGERKDPTGAMAAVAKALSNDDINNLAHYLASHQGE